MTGSLKEKVLDPETRCRIYDLLEIMAHPSTEKRIGVDIRR
jgi:hypothetical protein